MNRYLRYLALATLCISAYGIIQADYDKLYNKTQMNGRSDGTNLSFWYGPGIPEMLQHKDKDKDKIGVVLFATTFIRAGEMDADYWTPQNKNHFGIADFGLITDIGALGTTDVRRPATSAQKMAIFNNAYHDAPLFGDDTTVSFDPEQTAYGVTLAYDHRLDKMIKGLYFNVQVPFVHVENKLGLRIEDDNDSNIRIPNLQRYLAGKFDDPYGNWSNSVKRLNFARISGKSNTTGIADVDVRLGYTFLDKSKYHASLNLGVTVPAGTATHAVKLDEAIVGNHQHWGFGGGLNGDLRVWGNTKHNLILYADLKYRYLFKDDETRTLGLKDTQWGPYVPLVNYQANQENLFRGGSLDIVPAANITTLNVEVTPGSEFDGIIALAYNNGDFSANLGYNLYCRSTEKIERDETNPFENGNEWAYIDNAIFHLTPLTAHNLDISVAKTHSQVTHRFFCGVAWTWKNWTPIVNSSYGAYYEFANEDEAYHGWGISSTTGISF